MDRVKHSLVHVDTVKKRHNCFVHLKNQRQSQFKNQKPYFTILSLLNIACTCDDKRTTHSMSCVLKGVEV